MTKLSLDYAALLQDLTKPLTPAGVGQALLDAAAAHYRRAWDECSLVEFTQSTANYLYDVAGTRAERTVAAWAVTPGEIEKRDVSYQRGFPLLPSPDGTPTDRGHLIPHLTGGEFGPNIFAQHRPLNRGWSVQGKTFRALEREAAKPGTFYFGHLLYEDESDYPAAIETALLRGAALHVEWFRNRAPFGSD
ncbi:hypothetical protein ABZX92_45450 [Lentzea sp. NPDC006480]|uniref:hypothetical protein n=1 Tax=Lentzea sp. NPDC006480 TaxID=3157176 RepID=UPI0033AB1C1F